MARKKKTKPKGRKAFAPKKGQREQVQHMKAMNWSEQVIADIIGISRSTLRKHFEKELAIGKHKVGLALYGKGFNRAMDDQNPNAFSYWKALMKSNHGLVETSVVEHNVHPDVAEMFRIAKRREDGVGLPPPEPDIIDVEYEDVEDAA